MPRVLIADELSPAAVAIFKDRGVDVDVKTGLKKDELLQIIGDETHGVGVARREQRRTRFVPVVVA